MASSDQEQLIRTLCTQLESRLRDGDVSATEQIFDSHPQLRQDLEGALDLIYVEITTREAMGQTVDAAELKRRFPDWSERIDRLLSVHRALQTEPISLAHDTDATPTDTSSAVFDRHRQRSPQRIDQFEILGEIGRGGMGVVYKARQPELNRVVALKVIRESLVSGESGQRLIREAETVARLDHPLIVRIYAAGFDDQVPYICLEYVEGGSLADKLSKSTFDAKSACRMLKLLASAMDYAHEQGVIHRDLKPANILLSRDGQPRIADFGLAKTIHEQAADSLNERLTRTGEILGSLCYMSPEQVSGRDDLIGPVTDIYGLGTILYEMLVGRPPFVRESPLDTAQDIQFRDPVSPRTFVPGIPRDVETICLKCLEKDPQRRYASAALLAEDLDRFLSGGPIHARPVGRLTHLWRWVKLHPARAAVIAGSAALLLTYSVLQTKHAREISGINRQLDQSLTNERSARQLADEHFWRALEGVSTVHRKLADTGLDHEPRMQQARLEVVDDALEIIAGLDGERPDDNRVRNEEAQLLRLRGRILVGMGRWDDALTAFDRSIDFYNSLLEHSPEDDQLLLGLAAATAGQAETLKWLTHLDQAELAYATAAKMLREQADRQPDNLSVQSDFVQSLVSWAAVLLPNRPADARPILEEADQRSLDLLARWADSPREHSIRGQVLRARGHVASATADPQAAVEFYQQAIAAFERALALAPGDRSYQVFIVETSLACSEQLQRLRDFEGSRVPLEVAERIAVELTGRYPSIRQYQNLRVTTIGMMSWLEQNLGNELRAVELAEQAVEQRRRILQQAPDDKRAASEFAVEVANLANRLAMTKSVGEGRLARSEQYAREALAVPGQYSLGTGVTRQISRFARYTLVLAFTFQDRVDDAKYELEALARDTIEDPNELRELADGWSELLASGLRTGQGEQFIKEATDKTLLELERAIKADFRDHAELTTTESLVPLHSDPRFQALVKRAQDGGE